MNEIQAVIEDIRYLITRNKISEALLLLETLQAWMDAKIDSITDQSPERKVFFIDIGEGVDPNDIDGILNIVKAKMEDSYFFDGKNLHTKDESVTDEIANDINSLFRNSGMTD